MPYFNFENHKIHYIEAGVKNENAIIFLPGNTASSMGHINDLEKYSEKYHVISIDFLGTGKSDRVSEWTSTWFENSARQIAELKKHLKLEKTILVGVSGGGIIGLMCAMFYPEMFIGVVADSCMDKLTETDYKNKIVYDRILKTEDQVNFWKFMQGEDWEKIVYSDTKMLSHYTAKEDIFDGNLSEIKCEVLLTFAKNDTSLTDLFDIVKRMGTEIHKSSIHVENNGSHPLIWTNPEIFYNLLNDFIERIFK